MSSLKKEGSCILDYRNFVRLADGLCKTIAKLGVLIIEDEIAFRLSNESAAQDCRGLVLFAFNMAKRNKTVLTNITDSTIENISDCLGGLADRNLEF